MMTAILSGILFLSGAGWAWGQLEAIRIPTPRWTLPVSNITGQAGPGEQVSLLNIVEGISRPLGSAVVESYGTEGRTAGSVIIKSLELAKNANPLDITDVQSAPVAGASPVFVAKVSRPVGIALFPRIYMQAVTAAIIMLVGAVIIYAYVGVKPAPVDFLIATDGEMKKVNWGTRKVILDSTYVVIGATFLIAGLIYIFDTGLFKFFRAIGILG